MISPTWRFPTSLGNSLAGRLHFIRDALPVLGWSPSAWLLVVTKCWPHCALFSWGNQRFYARLKDWFAIDEVILHEEYWVLKEILQNMEAPRVVDMGANIGLFSLHVLRLSPKAHLVSVEPEITTFRLLERNRGLYPKADWQVLRLAAWKNDDPVKFLSSNSSTSSHIDVTQASALTVPGVSLATFLKVHAPHGLDLLKLDVEGAEEAFLCSHPALLASIRNLIVEVHPDRCDAPKLMRALAASYGRIYRLEGRKSTKPLLLATNGDVSPPPGCGVKLDRSFEDAEDFARLLSQCAQPRIS